jgi:cephalosporin hydroxylase
MLKISVDGISQDLPLYSPAAFEAVSREWVRIGWSLRYYHTFSWQGRPILQLPEDLVRIQEVVVALKPDLIIETGIFDGGSMLFYASLCETLGRGRVLGIDIKVREETRTALEAHALAGRIELHEGDSISDATLSFVRSRIRAGDTVMVMLDSHHSHAHVAAELEAYATLVTPGSCIVAADGIMRDLADVPGGESDWASDNPAGAAIEFASRHPEFDLRPPSWHPNVSLLTANVTYWPDAWLWRRQ